MTEKQIKHIKSIIDNRTVKHFGVEIPLTDEQLKEFEKMIKPKYKNPYERVKNEEHYYTIIKNYSGEYKVDMRTECHVCVDNDHFNSGNYYNDKEFAEQVAMELNLQQKLRKFTYDNGWSEELWEDDNVEKFYVYFYTSHRAFNSRFKISSFKTCNTGQVYYISNEIARRAIDEIIVPFMKENPTFKW